MDNLNESRADLLATWLLLADGYLPPRHLNLFAKSPKGTGTATGVALSEDHLQQQAKAYDDWNLYVCLNPSFKASGKPSQKDITFVEWMVLDIDPMPKGPSYRYSCSVLDIVAPLLLEDYNLVAYEHYAVVNTGRGLQLWLPVKQGNLTCSQADRVIKGLTASIRDKIEENLNEIGYHVDTSCADIARVVRLPGTINHKTGRRATFMGRVPEISAAGIDLEQFQNLAVAEHEPPKPLAAASMFYLAPALLPINLETLLRGTDTSYESRHKRLYALAKNLQELGVDRAYGTSLTWRAAKRCVPSFLPTNPTHVSEIYNIISQAWGPSEEPRS